jgi:hypothetical protein
MLLISKLLEKKGSLWLRWSHHCIYLTNDHSNVPYVAPEHLNSPVYFRVVMSAIISMKNRSSIRVMFYLLHLYLFSDTGVQRDLMLCRICQTFQSTPAFKWGSCWMIISFLYNVLWIVICPFVIFHFTFVLSVLWFTASDYPYGIIKLFSLKHVMFSVEENRQRFNINNNIL